MKLNSNLKMFGICLILGTVIFGGLFVTSSKKVNQEQKNKVETFHQTKEDILENLNIDEVVELDKGLYRVTSYKLGIAFEIPNDNTVYISNNSKYGTDATYGDIEFSVNGGGFAVMELNTSNRMAYQSAKENIKSISLDNCDDGTKSFLMHELQEISVDMQKGYSYSVHTIDCKTLNFLPREYQDIYYYIFPTPKGIITISESYGKNSYTGSPKSINTMKKIISSIDVL